MQDKKVKHTPNVENAVVVELPPAKVEDVKITPLFDKLSKVQRLTVLSNNYRKLDSTLKQLDDFTINQTEEGDDTRANFLSIRDDRREEFRTGNPVIIAEVIEFLKARIYSKLKETEAELLSTAA